jgi:uncharacterized protein (TIGR02266 family)
LLATTAGFEALSFNAPDAPDAPDAPAPGESLEPASVPWADETSMEAFGELPTPLPGEADDAFAALMAEAGFPAEVIAPPADAPPSLASAGFPEPEPEPEPEPDDPFASLTDASDAEQASPVDEFASFAALSLELHSAIEQSVEALTQSAPTVAPERPLSTDDHEMALRMTEEVHLSDTEIANIFASGPPRRDAFAFELAAEAPAPVAPPVPAPEPAPAPAPAKDALVAPAHAPDDDDPFAELETALEDGRLGALPARDAGDDPFADLAAELADFDPPTGGGHDSDPDMLLEPIPGYDMRMPVDTPAPRASAPSAPPAKTSPSAPPPPASAPPVPAAPLSEPAMMFRPTLGRVDRPRGATGPIRPAARTGDRGASTFAALAAEMDIEGVDPWRELDISDLRSAGHPGPLPTPLPQPISPARQRAIADRTHRANLAVKVGVEYGTSFFTGFSGNVSRGGLFVATHQTIPVGARVELFFEMPDGHSVAAPAQVRWVRDIEQANLDGSSPGIGLAFVNLTHDDAIVLERYVTTHAASVLYDEGHALP